MSYCLNPHCSNPQNSIDSKFCLSCGSPLLLKNRYRAVKLIGTGGFGRTFLGVDEDRLKTPCAIKQFFPQTQNSAALSKATELFNREAVQLLKLGEHPQIPALYAYFEQDQRLYLIQEFIDGGNLLQELQQQGPFNEAKICSLLQELLPVLQFIHAEGVIHRDIKPENILRRQSRPQTPTSVAAARPLRETLVLVDFGVAKQGTESKLAASGTITGTQGYAPLEQIWRGQAYPASDLYSLAVTCIHLLTGVPPHELFDSRVGQWVWWQVLRQKGGCVSDQLRQILDKMLAEAVQDRYQSAAEVLQALNGAYSQTVTQVSWPVTEPPSPTAIATPPQHGSPTAVAASQHSQPKPPAGSAPADEISKLLEIVKTEMSQVQPKQPASAAPNPTGKSSPSSQATKSIQSTQSTGKSPAFDPIQADLEALRAEFGEKS